MATASRYERVRIALIGCGQIADAHLQELRRVPRAEVIAVCDRHIDLARQAAVRFDVPHAFSDVAAMLALEPEVVHITTPPHTHFPLGRQCLEAGAHLYVEKPFTVDSAEAAMLVSLAESRGLRVCLGHDQLLDPAWQQCRELVASGVLGDVVHVEAVQGYDLEGPFGSLLASDPGHWVHRLPGGIFQNVMSHALARVTDLVPDPELRAHAHWWSRGGFPFRTELRALLVGRQASGTVTFTSAARPVQKIARIFGTKLALEVDLDARTVTRYASSSLPGALYKMQLPWQRFTSATKNLWNNSRRLWRSDLHYFEGMRATFEQFHGAIRGDAPMPIRHEDALRVTRLMEDIFRQCQRADVSSDAWELDWMREEVRG